MTQGLGGIQQWPPETDVILGQPWQNQRDPKARTTAVQGARPLVQFQPPAMGFSDSGDQRQAKARPRLTAAIFQTHEPLHHAGPVRFRHTRPGVRH
jgi:hypothetical protein